VKPERDTRGQFIRYLIAGLCNTGFTYALLIFAMRWIDDLLAYSIVYVLGIAVGYGLQSRFVFRVPIDWRFRSAISSRLPGSVRRRRFDPLDADSHAICESAGRRALRDCGKRSDRFLDESTDAGGKRRPDATRLNDDVSGGSGACVRLMKET
jgi:hypothetical protein